MKKIRFYLLLLILVGCDSNESIKNLQNCKELNLGMSEREAIETMGKPLSSRLYYSQTIGDTLKSLSFKYAVPAASTGIIVEISVKTNSVVRINCDEEVIKE